MAQDPKHIVILGAGESGLGAALLVKKQGHGVFVSSLKNISSEVRKKLEIEGIEYEEGQHTPDQILKADLIIKSPGIPDNAPIMKLIRESGIPSEGEIGYAARFVNAPIIAITGSNGKTTTTLLTHHIMKNAGVKAALCGNVGTSLARLLAEGIEAETYVMEISSFQLDDAPDLRPDIAVITNITEDHLDRYDHKLENYALSKFGITRNQGPEQVLIYNADDPVTGQYLSRVKPKARLIPFSIERPLEEGAWIENEQIIINIKPGGEMKIEELALQGKHNQYNSMAAGLAARLLSIRKEVIRESLADFETIEHRLEPVLEVLGVEFINDSKATNVNSTYYALESMKKPTVWIVGGVDKGNDYSQILDIVKKKVKAIVCLGAENHKIHDAFADHIEFIFDTHSMAEAVRTAHNLASKGDAVLLSPACASFDLFENYEDRGRQFKQQVRQL
ncbi:MAG: UDP-N-acetylmuramoyl-L-alanine--D-glutamate ligase [Bacteroidota bacterium]|nr:UDP-N-acetylmuramoyl-L-alanine--D-glutamate ligase [Bacteroidota bacterium]